MHGEHAGSLLSIVIPTKNRQVYALSAIESILRIPDSGLEVVVQDNSDTRELEKLLRQRVKDSRLKYNYTSSPLSIVGNFEASLGLATGEYICFIGDDDGVNPEIIEAAKWAKENEIDALKPGNIVHYLWPGSGVKSTRFTHISQESGQLTIQSFTGKIIFPKMEQEMRKLVQKGGLEYLMTELPKLYHGIVKRECLDKIRNHNKLGNYFGGLSPDIYAAISIAGVASHVASIDYPLTLPGACRKSGSVASTMGTHTGNLKDAPHFQYRGEYEWDELVPRYYSVATIWADSARAAIRDSGRDDLLGMFNVAYLSACCVWMHPRYKAIIIRNLIRALRASNKSVVAGTLQFIFSFFTGPGRLLFKRVMNRLKIIIFGEHCVKIDNVADMSEASERLAQYLKASKLSFNACVSEDFKNKNSYCLGIGERIEK